VTQTSSDKPGASPVHRFVVVEGPIGVGKTSLARRLADHYGSELWLDGGHNADGARAVAAALGDLEERVPRPLVLVERLPRAATGKLPLDALRSLEERSPDAGRPVDGD